MRISCGADNMRLQEQITSGNFTTKFAAALVWSAIRCGVKAIFENPHSSMAWHSPERRRILTHGAITEHITDYCQNGEKWRNTHDWSA